LILETVRQAQERTGEAVEHILAQLGFPSATYYRWQHREEEGHLVDTVVVPRRRVPVPTSEEVDAGCSWALIHPLTGYKRLTWLMVDEDVVYLRPWQVYTILKERDLPRRGPKSALEALKRLTDYHRPLELMEDWSDF
jgi:hypothetical protein